MTQAKAARAATAQIGVAQALAGDRLAQDPGAVQAQSA